MEEDKGIEQVVVPAYTWDSKLLDKDFMLKDVFNSKCEELGLTQRKVEKLLDMEHKSLKAILEQDAQRIDFVNVLKLSNFLGIPVDRLAKSYTGFMNVEQIKSVQTAREAGYIVNNFDVNGLAKLSITSSENQSLASRICRFLGLDNIYQYSIEAKKLTPAYSRTKRTSSDKMRIFWVYCAITQFKGIDNPNPYDRNALKRLLPKIRPYTRDVKKGLRNVMTALFHVGVTVIYQPSIDKLQVRGATMCVNGKPCVVISDVNKRYATLWFALLHELYHVLFDFDDIKMQIYHTSGDEGDLFLTNEQRADDFAGQFLLDDSRRELAYKYISSDKAIDILARGWGVHPSIIYAMYAHDFNKGFYLNKDNPDIKLALDMVNTHPFERQAIEESVDELKEFFKV